jgi:sigma-B regulation protein RsbU (phosphoserine phosphatase)
MPDSRNKQFPLTELMKSLLPITPMGKAMCLGVLAWFLNWGLTEGDQLLGSVWLKRLMDAGSALAFIPLLYFLCRGAGWVKEHLLWRLRWRLIVTYLLIGGLPLLLFAFLMGLIAYAFATQSSVGQVSRRLDGYLEQSQAAAQSLGEVLNQVGPFRNSAEEVRRKLQERADALAAIFPEVHVSARFAGEDISVHGRSPAENGSQPRVPVLTDLPRNSSDEAMPQWLNAQPSFHGLVVEETPVRALHVHHVVRAGEWVLHLSYPIGRSLCAQLSGTANLEVRAGLALMEVVTTASGTGVDNSRAGAEYLQRGGFPIFKPVTDWSTGRRADREALLLDPSFMSPAHIWWRVQQFRSSGVVGRTVFLVISALSAFLALIALSAIISAIFLTRSITGAVHHLYEGTRRVEVGDLDHEIPITGHDQLGDLSHSFNRMTRSIRELLRVSEAKQRLDQEMKIAAQVQSRLFPRALPKTDALDFAPGVCIPARAVSGDYYDFFATGPGRVSVAVADVCGKGVSAALMMANLQAILRGQAVGGSPTVRCIVERVNQQLVTAMIDASYITFFYAEYDEATATLRYTNAGHNPPLLYRKGSGEAAIESLDRGGTVLGLFHDAAYEEAEFHLRPGDVLAAFTDGLVEARNPAGEEFGEARIIQSLRESAHLPAGAIERHILETVRRWTGEVEQEDDLTLVLFKVKDPAGQHGAAGTPTGS